MVNVHLERKVLSLFIILTRACVVVGNILSSLTGLLGGAGGSGGASSLLSGLSGLLGGGAGGEL